MNKKYEPVIDFASFHKWRDDFNRGIQDVVDADSREQMGKSVGEVLTRSLDAIFEQAAPVKTGSRYRADTQDTTSADQAAAWTPCANCAESDAEYLIEVELAGVSMEQVNVEIIGNRLVVAGVAQEQVAAAQMNPDFRSSGFSTLERPAGNFSRTFVLPTDSDIDAVDASMENGLLTLRIARQNQTRRRVKVQRKPG